MLTKQKLIEDNMKLVYSLISKEYPTYLSDEDIVQTGMVGLCKAADTWDESKSKFSTFAFYCIRNEIRQEFRRRAKHQGVLSLDYEYDIPEGIATLGELIPGDEDVAYVDIGIDRSQLTPRQQRIYELCEMGMNCADIAREIGISKQAVWKHLRTMRGMRG